MPDGSIVIKLFRNGLGKGPEYSIEVYDSGRVVYEGISNVKIKDRIETSLDEEKIVTILENLKDSGIFSINQNYSVSESSGRPFTRLTIKMPGEDGNIKKKSVVHHDDEPMISHGLKDFEDKIDEMVESYRWVKVPKTEKKIEPTPASSSKSFEKTEKKSSFVDNHKGNSKSKIVLIGVIGIIVVLALAFFIFLNTDAGSDETPNIIYDPPQILSLTPDASIYMIADAININFEYANVTHGEVYDISGLVSLYYEQDLIDSYSFIVNSSMDFEETCAFDSDDSWPLGNYTVVFELKDEISNLIASDQASFTLYEKIPKIIKFTPASSVISYQVYTPEFVFDLGDTFYAYLEYTGINTTNADTECNIFLKLNVTDYSGTVFWSYSENKTTVGNNAHYWTIDTNSSWTSSVCNVNVYLYDYNTGLSVSDSELLVIN